VYRPSPNAAETAVLVIWLESITVRHRQWSEALSLDRQRLTWCHYIDQMPVDTTAAQTATFTHGLQSHTRTAANDTWQIQFWVGPSAIYQWRTVVKVCGGWGGGSAPPAVAWAQWLKWYARLWLAWSHGGGTFHSIPRGRIIHGATYFYNADQRSLVWDVATMVRNGIHGAQPTPGSWPC